MKQIEPLWDISGQWIGYSQEELEYFAEYLVRRKNMLLERKHTLEAQSWAQCHEDELCQIMKADYPNEGIAALALEKQYGLNIRCFGYLQIMCDNHYTAVFLMCQSGKQLNNLCAVFCIQISRRLICENDLRMNG